MIIHNFNTGGHRGNQNRRNAFDAENKPVTTFYILHTHFDMMHRNEKNAHIFIFKIVQWALAKVFNINMAR